ncbi:MAG TPA: hypothetical protein VK832_00325 [Burkholderiaceae bacterium]|nr:hypothetical protein [Burkholderiaceae bacterium]
MNQLNARNTDVDTLSMQHGSSRQFVATLEEYQPPHIAGWRVKVAPLTGDAVW